MDGGSLGGSVGLGLRGEPAGGGLCLGAGGLAAVAGEEAVADGLLEADPDGLEDAEGGAGEVVALGHLLEAVDGPLEVLPRLVQHLEVLAREQDVDGRHHDDGVEGPEKQRVRPVLRRVQRRELLPLRLEHLQARFQGRVPARRPREHVRAVQRQDVDACSCGSCARAYGSHQHSVGGRIACLGFLSERVAACGP